MRGPSLGQRGPISRAPGHQRPPPPLGGSECVLHASGLQELFGRQTGQTPRDWMGTSSEGRARRVFRLEKLNGQSFVF
jgi:hypothetical protein